MGFKDSKGNSLINDEQKVRITLSTNARIKMEDDMDVFRIPKAATFINTVFDNYKLEAKSSISLYRQQRELELDHIFSESRLDPDSRSNAVKLILDAEEKQLVAKAAEYNSAKGESKLYHINDKNKEYLDNDCDEEQYYSRPALYIRAVIEEYCSLPFIERERIYKKNTYKKIEQAISENKILKIKTMSDGKEQSFYVYPYKIVPDPFHTQSYLTCYSRKADQKVKDSIVASFSMARIGDPTVLPKSFHLSKEERNHIESQITKYSPAYLVGKPELIRIRLTEKGKQLYLTRVFFRPDKIESLSSDDVYVFDCTHRQIFNFFFSFGAEAEVLSPPSLRESFKRALAGAIGQYSSEDDT